MRPSQPSAAAAAGSVPATPMTRQRSRRLEGGLEEDTLRVDDIDVDAFVELSPVTSTPLPRPPPAFLGIALLPDVLTQKVTGLEKTDLTILRKKQRWLREYEIDKPPIRNGANLSSAVNATLVFAQQDAGTAVCIAPEGILLTCSHCVAESAEELDGNREKWLIFSSGQVVKAKCVAWDPRRDLALLRIVACQQLPNISPNTASSSSSSSVQPRSFLFVIPANTLPPLKAALACVGHPGSEDLEASKPGIKTNYDVLHVSMGVFRGYAAGQDVQDNSEIGALMHDCWTYWGHSGAPLVEQKSGRLMGLHSSWDDQTGMRRGIGLEAIKAFLSEHTELLRSEGVGAAE